MKPFGKGYHFHSRDKVWSAYITDDGVKLHLGYFDRKEDAMAARAAAVAEWYKKRGFNPPR